MKAYSRWVRAAGALGLVVALGVPAGCGTDEIEDPAAAMERIVEAMHDFHVANEWYYYENQRYTTDLNELRSVTESELRLDSVTIRPRVAEDGQGMSSVATHHRTGPDLGCVFVWGDMPNRTTPGGRPHDGSNLMVCDAAFDEVESRYRVADPPG